jgi:hypothetical protein
VAQAEVIREALEMFREAKEAKKKTKDGVARG